MSIEQDLNSIATSLSTIAKMLGFLVDQQQIKTQETQIPETIAPVKKKAAKPVLVETQQASQAKEYTVQDLKEMAQKIASGMDPAQIGQFTEFVRFQICRDMGVTRLSEIPVDKIQTAAEQLITYAKAGGIDVR